VRERLQHREISQWIARECFWMNGNAVAWRRWGVSIAVVGPGAIGSTVAACLHQAGHTPLVCGRTARDDLDVRPDPTVLGGERIVVPTRVRTDPGEVRQPGQRGDRAAARHSQQRPRLAFRTPGAQIP